MAACDFPIIIRLSQRRPFGRYQHNAKKILTNLNNLNYLNLSFKNLSQFSVLARSLLAMIEIIPDLTSFR